MIGVSEGDRSGGLFRLVKLTDPHKSEEVRWTFFATFLFKCFFFQNGFTRYGHILMDDYANSSLLSSCFRDRWEGWNMQDKVTGVFRGEGEGSE